MRAEDVKTIGLMGGGVMGGGIAQVLAAAGYRVVLRDISEQVLAKTRSSVVDGRFGLKAGVERGKLTEEQMQQTIERIRFTVDAADLHDVDLLVEAIPEDLDLKRKVFAELDSMVKPEAIFATNTSGFAIADLNQSVSRKNRFIGMHFFSPVPAMKLVEVIYSPETAEETVNCLMAICEKAGKIAIRVKDAPGKYGFVANRIYFAAVAEARKVLDEGVASAEDINAAMCYGFNWPVGPLAMGAGVRTGWT